MKLFTKLLIGSAFAGAVAATAYSYVKKYSEIASKHNVPDGEVPQGGSEPENEKREYASINMDIAKEAAKETYSSIKAGAEKAWGVAKDSAKAVGDIVKENYGDSMNSAKQKVTDTYEVVKEKVVDTYEDVKAYAGEKAEIIKEKATSVYEDVKEKVSDTFRNDKEVDVEIVSESVCAEENTPEETPVSVSDQVNSFVEEASSENNEDFRQNIDS